MTTWTPSARERLDNYVKRARTRVAGNGADADEVAADLQNHIETEVAALNLPVVTADDVQQIIARTGAPPEPETPEEPQQTNPPGAPRQLRGVAGPAALFIFGVLIPAVSIGFELVTHMCAGTFFDPIPTWFHVALVAAVPIVNLIAWRQLRQLKTHVSPWLWTANSVAAATAAIYAIRYLPMTPFAFVGILFLGMGLLPLSPLFALVCALRLRHHLRVRQVMNGQLIPRWWPGFLSGFALVAALAAPAYLTDHWLQVAGSESAEESLHAVKMLRIWGSREAILRRCYGQSDRLLMEVFDQRPIPMQTAQETYYRVTGAAYNSVPPPLSKYQRRGADLFNEFEWDSALGSDAVAGQVKGLSLRESRMDAVCNSTQGWAYCEWTIEFGNEHNWSQREARAQVELPPGGVVSRVSLWINGEPHEAAFGGRSQVTQAYQQVAVQQRRDPVLVTTAGPDRVLIQCFPVAPKGGTMKIRLGITAPLIMETTNTAALRLPMIIERNFRIPSNFRHSCWIESDAGVTTRPQELSELSRPDGSAVRGELAQAELEKNGAVIRFRATPEQIVRAMDKKHPGRLIVQTLSTHAIAAPARIAVVLDGSAEMSGAYSQVSRALDGFPRTSQFAIWLAQDGVQQIFDSAQPHGETASRAVARLQGAGGQDNIGALIQAWEWAQVSSNSVILWIHGAQPALLGKLELLKQRLDWKHGFEGPVIVDAAVHAGPNRITEALATSTALMSMPRLAALDEDLERLLSTWAGRRIQMEFVQQLETATALNPLIQGAGHIVRLWALGQVRELMAARRVKEAIALATEQQLVTPVSGATVLETHQQYAANELTPADPLTTPTIPEPATWMIIAGVVGVMLGIRVLGRTRNRVRG